MKLFVKNIYMNLACLPPLFINLLDAMKNNIIHFISILTSNRMPLSAINNKLHEFMMIKQNFTESDRTRLKFVLSS